MLFNMRAVTDPLTRDTLQRESERRLLFATDRFEPEIREIDVVLSDLNGPRGGVDKRCTLVARLRRGGTLEIQETRSSFVVAIRLAAKRLRLALTRQIGGKRQRVTARHTQQVGRLADASS